MVHIYDQVAKSNFSENETGQSSAWRELKGKPNVMKSHVNILKGNTVKHQTNNQNVVRALSKGSKTDNLQAIVIIFPSFALRTRYNYLQSGSPCL